MLQYSMLKVGFELSSLRDFRLSLQLKRSYTFLKMSLFNSPLACRTKITYQLYFVNW